MGKWNYRSRFHRRKSPMRWYSDRHSSYSSGYGEEDGIPVWEKKFCEVIGSVPWQKVVEASTFKSWYRGNVITWNDSACEETFLNEKKRFWSQVNGLRYDISLPDPNLYISKVDWDTYIDPELIRDLERAYFAPPDEVKSGYKRERQNESWSGNDSVPIEETHTVNVQWNGSDKVHDRNGWNLSESSSDRIKDKVRPWEAKTSSGNEKSWDCRENPRQGNDGWDKSKHQNKKAKCSESVPVEEYEMPDNPWEAKPSCGNQTSNDAAWEGCSGKEWDDRGWGSGGWESWELGNQVAEMKEWSSKRYSHDIREPKGYSPCKVGFDNAALRDYGPNAAGRWQTWRDSETNRRSWDVKPSSDGWGRRNKERDDSCGYHSNYKSSRYRRYDHQNRKVNF